MGNTGLKALKRANYSFFCQRQKIIVAKARTRDKLLALNLNSLLYLRHGLGKIIYFNFSLYSFANLDSSTLLLFRK